MKILFLSLIVLPTFIAGVVEAQEKNDTGSTRTKDPDYYNVVLSNAPLSQQEYNWSGIETVFGRKGTGQGDVFKVTFPRTDLKVKMENVTIDPGLALTSWIAFRPMGADTMAMGDMVLLEKEIAPAMGKLIENGFEVSALHNHITGESPKVMYMHFEGLGGAVKLAESMKAVLAQTKTPLGPPPPKVEHAVLIDWGEVEVILGYKGNHNGKLLQFGIPRVERIREGEMEVPPFMGMATGINFQKEGKKAATTGDLVLLAEEVNPVIRALTENGIAVTAVHNHMLNETPRLFFIHFWGYDDPEKLARGLRAALDKTNSARAK